MQAINDCLMLIDGKMVASVSGEWLASINPANEEALGRVPMANAVDVDRAVQAALRAQPAWRATPVSERATLLRELARRLLTRWETILPVEVLDTGNTITKMRSDLSAAVAHLEYCAGIAMEVKGETMPVDSNVLHFTTREPYGVVGRIAPFNHPLYFAVTGLAGPLVTGNCVVIKTPDQSPLSAVQLAEVCCEVLPPGVVNIVSGVGVVAGNALVRHPKVRRIAFTGSVPTGLAIQRAAAEVCVKHISLELGGKNPMIIFPDVDPDLAAEVAVAGMNFAWQGQSCGSASRLMLHESIHDAVLERIIAKVSALRVGHPLLESSQMGPINARRHFERVLHYVAAGSEDGARLVCGGKRPAGPQFERGYWIEPTVFADVTMEMRIAREEIFGPVLSVLRWRSIDQVAVMANDTEYGLTCAIWTQDVKAALRLSRNVDAGYVWINERNRHFLGTPFGGTKNSGVGREECFDELMSYTQPKAYHLSLQ